jgi:hypothetical protein
MEKETNWEWASKSANIKWDRKGADNVFDHDKTPMCSAESPAKTAFRVTQQDLKQPIRVNILEDLRSFAEELQQSGKISVHYGWMIRHTRGTGEVHFYSAFTGEQDGPRLTLMIRAGPDEDPLTSILSEK